MFNFKKNSLNLHTLNLLGKDVIIYNYKMVDLCKFRIFEV